MPHPTLALLLVPTLAFVPFAFVPLQGGGKEDPLPPADPAVTRAELEHHVRFLASDELAGRSPMTAGFERASQYLAHALAAAKLEPAGENGTWFESTGLQRLEYPKRPRVLLTLESGEVRELENGVEFNLRPRGRARSTEKLPLRFFYDYNHARMPQKGNPAEALYFSATKSDKKRILEEKGIANLDDWGLEIEVRRMGDASEVGEPKDLAPRVIQPDEPEACELIELRGPILADWERRAFTHIQLVVDEVPSPYADHNVVGRIRGAGTAEHPELAQEVVVLSAHYDHLGIRPRPRGPEDADALMNGADDNASGCATLLELAQAFAAAKPARTLIVLFTTDEESGGRGCRRYIEAPPEPLAKTVANLNLEMLGRPDELVGGPGKLWLTGYERSNLGPAWQGAGLAIVADPRPKEGFFQRSDNYALALEGIVAQTLSTFGGHKEYHTPRDEPDTLDYAHLEAAAQVALAAARTLADGSLVPAWGEGQRPKKIERRPREEEGQPRDRERDEPRRGRGAKSAQGGGAKEGQGSDGKDGDDKDDKDDKDG